MTRLFICVLALTTIPFSTIEAKKKGDIIIIGGWGGGGGGDGGHGDDHDHKYSTYPLLLVCVN